MVLTEKTHAGSFILSEAPRFRSRENAKINAPQILDAGTVLGRLLTASAAVAGANTGNGAATVGAVIGARTQIGSYRLACVAAAANAGTFNLEAPDGTHVRQITVGGGAHVSQHLTVTIADGGTDFVVGDSFTITVTGGDYEQLDPAATTGEQSAAAILIWPTDASAGDTGAALIVRDAEVNGSELVWPNGFSAANKESALARLAEVGIIVR